MINELNMMDLMMTDLRTMFKAGDRVKAYSGVDVPEIKKHYVRPREAEVVSVKQHLVIIRHLPFQTTWGMSKEWNEAFDVQDVIINHMVQP